MMAASFSDTTARRWVQGEVPYAQAFIFQPPFGARSLHLPITTFPRRSPSSSYLVLRAVISCCHGAVAFHFMASIYGVLRGPQRPCVVAARARPEHPTALKKNILLKLSVYTSAFLVLGTKQGGLRAQRSAGTGTTEEGHGGEVYFPPWDSTSTERSSGENPRPASAHWAGGILGHSPGARR